MKQFPLIQMCSDDPYERGCQYGEQASEWIHRAVEGYKRHFEKQLQQDWNSICRKSHLYFPVLEKDYEEELAEAKGISVGSGVSLDEILAINCRYEILKLKGSDEIHECTTSTLLPEKTTNGSTILTQNWDYRPWVEEHSVIISIDNKHGTKIIGITEAGQLVRNGMNNHGVGMCANNLTSTYDTGELGIPVTFLRRKALNAKRFQEACELIDTAKRGVSCNFMIASSEGVAVDLETTPGEVFRVYPKEGILTHANHMIAGASVDTNQGNKFRDRVLKEEYEQRDKLDINDIKRCLQNHKTFPGALITYPEASSIEAVCTHPPIGNYSPDNVWKTIASAIYDLNERVAYICKGNPCQGRYITYRL